MPLLYKFSPGLPCSPSPISRPSFPGCCCGCCCCCGGDCCWRARGGGGGQSPSPPPRPQASRGGGKTLSCTALTTTGSSALFFRSFVTPDRTAVRPRTKTGNPTPTTSLIHYSSPFSSSFFVRRKRAVSASSGSSTGDREIPQKCASDQDLQRNEEEYDLAKTCTCTIRI